MGEFLNNLYNNDNFILYLAIAIGVLVALFIIVYFWGKKDQKVEQSKKANIDEVNAFKEVNSEITSDNKVEVEEPKLEEIKEEKELEHSPLIVEDETEILPVINKEDMQKNEVTTTVFEPINEVKIDEVPAEEEIKEENSYTPNMEQTAYNLEKELSDLAKIKEEFNQINTSKEAHRDVDNNINKEIFSSVFISKDPKPVPSDDIELPKLKDSSENK